jgi:indolepyruvate ferredoxin oxidoreductase beta subunit
MANVTNIIVAGLGGQGVLKASDILSDVIFHAGLDIKKSEVHGMSQRGGSVASDVRYGAEVLSPMVPPGEADYVVVLEPTQVEVNAPRLRPGGVLIEPSSIDEAALRNKRSINVALLGALSAHLEFGEDAWLAAIRANLPEKLHEVNIEAFGIGRAAARAAAPAKG